MVLGRPKNEVLGVVFTVYCPGVVLKMGPWGGVKIGSVGVVLKWGLWNGLKMRSLEWS